MNDPLNSTEPSRRLTSTSVATPTSPFFSPYSATIAGAHGCRMTATRPSNPEVWVCEEEGFDASPSSKETSFDDTTPAACLAQRDSHPSPDKTRGREKRREGEEEMPPPLSATPRLTLLSSPSPSPSLPPCATVIAEDELDKMETGLKAFAMASLLAPTMSEAARPLNSDPTDTEERKGEGELERKER